MTRRQSSFAVRVAYVWWLLLAVALSLDTLKAALDPDEEVLDIALVFLGETLVCYLFVACGVFAVWWGSRGARGAGILLVCTVLLLTVLACLTAALPLMSPLLVSFSWALGLTFIFTGVIIHALLLISLLKGRE